MNGEFSQEARDGDAYGSFTVTQKRRGALVVTSYHHVQET